jgi:hypothetical protein
MRAPTLAVTVAALCLIAPASAVAAGFVDVTPAPVALLGTSSPEVPAVAVTASGEAVVAYTRVEVGGPHVYVVQRPRGGTWSQPLKVSPDGAARDPWLAVSANGELALLYRRDSELDVQIRPAGSQVFGTTAIVDAALGSSSPAVRAAYDAAGNLVAAWQATNASNNAVVRSSVRPADGAFPASPPTLTPATTTRFLDDLVVDPSGSRVIGISTFLFAGAIFAPAVGPPAPEQTVSSSDYPHDLRLAGTPDGTTALYTDLLHHVARVARAPFADGTSQALPGTSQQVTDLVADGAGALHALWRVGSELQAATAAPGAGLAFGPPVTLGAARTQLEGDQGSAVSGTGGDVLAVWLHDDAATTIAAAAGPAGADLAPIGTVAGGASKVRALATALGPAGTGVLAWEGNDGGGGEQGVFLAAYDGVAPVLDGVTIPAAGAVGGPLVFAASATDDQGATPALHWDFGDGASSDAAAPTHAYTAPGAFTVTVTARDGANNTSTQSGVVTVPALPEPPAPPAPPAAPRPPALSKVSFRPASFTPRQHGKGGSTLRVTLSAPATLKVTLRRCRNSRCTKTAAAGTLSRHLQAGAARVAFTGLIKNRPLRRAHYRATLVATDALGSRSARKVIAFRVR